MGVCVLCGGSVISQSTVVLFMEGWTRSWPIMLVHLKILICTFTLSDTFDTKG